MTPQTEDLDREQKLKYEPESVGLENTVNDVKN